MVVTVSSLILLIVIIIFLVGAIILVLTYLLSTFMGQPFVPTRSEDTAQILGIANMKKGDKLLELGCGDARFLAFAVENAEVDGTGVELNPLLVLFANIRGKLRGLKNFKVLLKDVRKVSYKDFDFVYIFLFPSLIEQVQDKLLKECKKGTVVISHGFVVPALHKYLENTLPGNGFKTFFYRIP